MRADRETVLYEVREGVALITLNRPEKLNAISRQLREDLMEALEEAEGDEAVRCVVLSGAGRAFCAGYDVAGASRGEGVGAGQSRSIVEDRDRLERILHEWFRIWDLRLPVIAKVHGHCLAGGTQLAAICDVTFVAEDARVGTPQLPLGAGFVAAFWAWLVGPKKAKEIFLPVGTIISGREAASLGLFNRAVPALELDEVVWAYARRVARTPKAIAALQKQAINRTQDTQGFRAAMLQAAEVDAIAHFSPPVLETNARIRKVGLKETIAAWQRGDSWERDAAGEE